MSHKILVVDDEKDILVTLQDLLEMEGYEVTCAYNGKSGLAKFYEMKPDLIMTDMMMPGMSGLELIHTIRGGTTQANIPIILMSAMVSFQNQEKEGWDDFIKKPSDIDSILDTIKKLLEK